jgi:hypothetical protein
MQSFTVAYYIGPDGEPSSIHFYDGPKLHAGVTLDNVNYPRDIICKLDKLAPRGVISHSDMERLMKLIHWESTEREDLPPLDSGIDITRGLARVMRLHRSRSGNSAEHRKDQ